MKPPLFNPNAKALIVQMVIIYKPLIIDIYLQMSYLEQRPNKLSLHTIMRLFLAILTIIISLEVKIAYASDSFSASLNQDMVISNADPMHKSDHNLSEADGYKRKSHQELKRVKRQGKATSIKLRNAPNL